MHLAVVVDGHDPDQGNRLRVAGDQYRSDLHRRGLACVGEHRPAVAVVVLSVQVGYEVDLLSPASDMRGGELTGPLIDELTD